MQLIICLETNKSEKSDEIYVDSLIKDIFDLSSNEHKLTYEYLDGKNNYKRPKVINKIRKHINSYYGESIVIYIFDTDDISQDVEARNFWKYIKQYCDQHSHDLVFFNRTIEEVFLGKRLNKSKEKRQEAIKFKNENKLNKLNKQMFNKSNYLARKSSNLLFVLEKYLKRK